MQFRGCARAPLGYPMVKCDHHPPEPGYMVCIHVKGPQDVSYFEEASKACIGVVCCET